MEGLAEGLVRGIQAAEREASRKERKERVDGGWDQEAEVCSVT